MSHFFVMDSILSGLDRMSDSLVLVPLVAYSFTGTLASAHTFVNRNSPLNFVLMFIRPHSNLGETQHVALFSVFVLPPRSFCVSSRLSRSSLRRAYAFAIDVRERG